MQPDKADEKVAVGIIGAGPIGLELAVSLKEAGVRYVQLDAGQIGHTMTWWPRNTQFFSTSERIAIAGVPIQDNTQGRITGEEYLAYLRSVVELFDLQINTYEPVTEVHRMEDGFEIVAWPLSGQRRYACQKLVLATGDMQKPNLLGIPGENLPHVSHYFTDPHRYFRKRLLIVGGRNSAVEAALRCWRAGSQVSISYRRATFDASMVKSSILPDVLAQIEFGNIGFYPMTRPIEITPQQVVLEKVETEETFAIPADFVLLSTGFVADMSLFHQAGVTLIGERQVPKHNPETMETDVPGLYVAGTATAGTQTRYQLFIENCHVHVGKIIRAITGKWPDRIGTIPVRRYELPIEDIQTN